MDSGNHDNILTNAIIERLRRQSDDITHIKESLAGISENTKNIKQKIDQHDAELKPLTQALNFAQMAAKILAVVGSGAAVLLTFSKLAHADMFPPRAGVLLTSTPAVVRLWPASGGNCSGFIIDKNRVMSAAHCSEAKTEIGFVEFQDGEKSPFKILYRGKPGTGTDVEIIEVDTHNITPMKLAETQVLPTIGMVYSYREILPMAYPGTYVENEKRPGRSQVGAGLGSIYPGDSGSAFLDANGAVCGVVTMREVGAPVFKFVLLVELQKALKATR